MLRNGSSYFRRKKRSSPTVSNPVLTAGSERIHLVALSCFLITASKKSSVHASPKLEAPIETASVPPLTLAVSSLKANRQGAKNAKIYVKFFAPSPAPPLLRGRCCDLAVIYLLLFFFLVAFFAAGRAWAMRLSAKPSPPGIPVFISSISSQPSAPNIFNTAGKIG